jgi:Putative prokaryotic signal transducing protein
MSPGEFVLAQAFGSRPEADLAKSILESAGIDAMIKADDAGGMYNPVAWGDRGFRVLVRAEDLDEARVALKPPDEGPRGNFVAVQSFHTSDQAEIARDALASVGVVAQIQDLTWTGSAFRLLVREEEIATARQVLQTPQKPAT